MNEAAEVMEKTDPIEPQRPSIPIERPLGTVNRDRSWHSRLSAIFALALMGSIGAGLLYWYYAGLMEKGTSEKSATRAAAPNVQGEMILPPLGPIPQPAAPPAVMPEAQSVAAESAPADRWAGSILGPPPIMGASASSAGYAAGAYPPAPTPPISPTLARQLAGAVFAGASSQIAGGIPMQSLDEFEGGEPLPGGPRPAARGTSALQEALDVPVMESRAAQLMPPRQWLLPKGAFIDCTLETAIDSSLPGMTTCITAVDTFSADGTLVLMERGTKLIGETRGEVQRGSARVFVAWTEARTPSGVVVPIASPGTDELGRSGLPGEVNRHFWERFGAAMLISVVEGAIQVAVANAQDGSGNTVINSPSAASDVLTEILKETIQIAPTLRKDHGESIQVLVARDIDFRGVYELAPR